MDQHQKIKGRWFTLAKIILTLIALYLVFSTVNVQELMALIRQVNLFYVALAALFYAASQVLSSHRLNQFFRVIGIHLSELFNLRLYFLGMFYSLVLPSELGGDGYKMLVLKRRFQLPLKDLFWALLLDRLLGLTALVALLLIFLGLIPEIFDYQWMAWWMIPFTLFTAYFLLKWTFPAFIVVFSKVFVLSLGVQLLQLAAAYALLLALGGGRPLSYLFIFLVSSVAASIPVTIGGAGIRELTFLYGAQWLHLEVDKAIALSLLFYLLKVIVSLAGAGITLDKPQEIRK